MGRSLISQFETGSFNIVVKVSRPAGASRWPQWSLKLHDVDGSRTQLTSKAPGVAASVSSGSSDNDEPLVIIPSKRVLSPQSPPTPTSPTPTTPRHTVPNTQEEDLVTRPDPKQLARKRSRTPRKRRRSEASDYSFHKSPQLSSSSSSTDDDDELFSEATHKSKPIARKRSLKLRSGRRIIAVMPEGDSPPPTPTQRPAAVVLSPLSKHAISQSEHRRHSSSPEIIAIRTEQASPSDRASDQEQSLWPASALSTIPQGVPIEQPAESLEPEIPPTLVETEEPPKKRRIADVVAHHQALAAEPAVKDEVIECVNIDSRTEQNEDLVND
eukprot:Protomagalhaensia_wolfi_Nauph_80__2037@NODE_2296_length_1136_cov_8_301732_g1796_i0_p1_GENE_NODE_2296_length_1136_cov_8_301732_g1796_i0NODE_2296_length_1136_cov_8_301732_g1796_i0_p1_ORF_typecomplete_len327_score39_01_NODE_2296_length_1136_cov_8_301732_g1796_i0371017